MKERRCVFCGSAFLGQKRNFEHIIPTWLVQEADLRQRKMEFKFRDRKFDATMSRIGADACVSCNSEASTLEGAARSAFSKIQSGENLEDADLQIFLDWLDKVRIGLWLWLLRAAKQQHAIEPKFSINTRVGRKDRLVAIAKYPKGPRLRGLGLWGFGEVFFVSPSAWVCL